MGCAAMNVGAGQGEPRADGKQMGRARRTAQDDLGRENISGKTRQRGDLYPHKFAERVVNLQMMRCDMERDGFHCPKITRGSASD